MPKVIAILLACLCLACVASAQTPAAKPSAIESSDAPQHAEDFADVVVPITAVRISRPSAVGFSGKLFPHLGVAAGFGTGFCLDPVCRFIATNYHVALAARADKIEHEKIVQRYLATGPDDHGATPDYIPNLGVFAFATQRDLAIYELRHPLSGHHGVAFSLDELHSGQLVDIYGYTKGVLNPFRKLTRFPAAFKEPTASGLLAFTYEPPVHEPIEIAGASGGIVVDRNSGKILGILCGTSETAAIAVPIQSLVDFVTKVQPFLAQKIFPASALKKISPMSADMYPKFVPPRSDELQRRPEDPYEVGVLRQKAQLLAESIRNFIAVQSFAWGSGDRQPDAEAAYEVQVVDGIQRFRSYPDGAKELTSILRPRLSGWATPYDEWSQLPKMLGTEYRLHINQAPDVVIDARRTKVFQYYASVEDNLCPFTAVDDYGFFTKSTTFAVACYGEVWTDEAMNIIRISERLDLTDKLKAYRGWQSFHVILTYGWLTRADEPPRLVPLTIYTEAADKKHVYWCRGHFTDYRVFSVRARLTAN